MGAAFGKNDSSFGDIFKECFKKRQLRPQYEVRNQYESLPSERLFDDMKTAIDGLAKAIFELSTEPPESKRTLELVSDMYQHWYVTNTLGSMVIKKCKEMWTTIQISHQKVMGERQLYSYEAMTLECSTQLSQKQEEIRVLKIELQSEKNKAIDATGRSYREVLERLAQDNRKLENENKQLREREGTLLANGYRVGNSRQPSEDIGRLQYQLKSSGELAQQLEGENAELKRSYQEVKQRIESLQASSTETTLTLQKDLEKAREEKNSLEGRVRTEKIKTDDRINVLERQISTLSRSFDDKTSENRLLTQQLELKAKQMEQVTRIIEQKDNVNTANISLAAELNKTQDQLAIARRQIEVFKLQQQRLLEDESKGLEAERRKANAERERAQQAQREFELERQRHEQEKQQLRNQLKNMKSIVDGSKDDVARAERHTEAKLNAKDSIIRDLEYKFNRLKSDCEKQTKSDADYQKQQQQLRETIEQLTEQNQRINRKLEESKKEAEDWRSHSKSLQEKLDKSDAEQMMLERRQLKERIEDLEGELAESKAMVRLKEREIGDQFQESHREIRDNEDTISRLREKIEELEEKLNKYE